MRKKLSVVIDTNIFISALLGGRTTKLICDAFEKRKYLLVLSKPMIKEIRAVLTNKFLGNISQPDVERLFKAIAINAKIVKPSAKIRLCRDPEDNMILEAAISAKADLIVTGDKDLLCLTEFSIPIVSPKKFLGYLNKN